MEIEILALLAVLAIGYAVAVETANLARVGFQIIREIF